MKRNWIVFVLLLVMTSGSSFAQKEVRSRLDFCGGWKFKLGDDVEYCKPEFDDSDWRELTVPHDWSVEGKFSEKNSGRNAWLPGGIGWYRKSFSIPKNYNKKHVEIQFDGIYKEAKIWLNGFPVGIQHDGYTSFYYDISELLSYEKENILIVRVDNSIQPNCRWYSGSGIYRKVWLTVTEPLHVRTWGTYITTPEATSSLAKVSVQTNIENRSAAGIFELQTVLLDPSGAEVAKQKTPETIGNYQNKNVQQEFEVATPKLWSLETPQMYTAVSTVLVNGKIVDKYSSRFGIRSIRFDANKGFFLNGENTKMKGVCLHHEAGVLGAAVPSEIWEYRLKSLKSIGCNAIRTAHNPASVEFLDLCDELGFLVMDEFVDKWDDASKDNPFFDTPFADPFFSTEWKNNFRETIRRDRNHPSVIIWSVGNENHSPGTPDQNQGLRTYGSFVRTMDPTRPVISGMERGRDCPVNDKVESIIESCEYMDLIALNYGEQWCKLIAEKNPGKPFVSTESYVYFNSELEKRFANIERSPWIDVIDNPQNMGLFLWSGFEYLGEQRKYPFISGTCGLFKTNGLRNYKSHLYEAFWSEKPHVYLAVYEGDADDFSTSGRWSSPPIDRNWNRSKNDTVDLVSYSNCEEVELRLNGKLIGRKKMADIPNFIMKWRDVRYKSGKIEAIGFNEGKEVCRSTIRTSGDAKKFDVVASTYILKPNQVLPIEVSVTDSKMNPLDDADTMIMFATEGNGEVMALDNGSRSEHFEKANIKTKKCYQGKCLCILRAGKDAGHFSLKIKSEGMKEKVVSFEVR